MIVVSYLPSLFIIDLEQVYYGIAFSWVTS